MRSRILALLLFTAACDPGAAFKLVDGNGTDTSWPTPGDSVHGRLNASAFTIDLSVSAVLDGPADVVLALDSTDLVIHDAKGRRLQLDHFTDHCDDSASTGRSRSKRCVFGRVNLQSTDYSPLDSLTVQFGYASIRERRVPLTARFVRIR
jgi:hypothetical protein